MYIIIVQTSKKNQELKFLRPGGTCFACIKAVIIAPCCRCELTANPQCGILTEKVYMQIDLLADHPDIIPLLAQWFFKEWSYLIPGKTLIDVEDLIRQRTNRNKIPLALVAFEGKELLGTVCLKIHDLETHMDLSPWLAGLIVSEKRRGTGIGRTLVSAIEEKAKNLEIKKLYLHTHRSRKFYSRLGWQVYKKADYRGTPVTIMEKELI